MSKQKQKQKQRKTQKEKTKKRCHLYSIFCIRPPCNCIIKFREMNSRNRWWHKTTYLERV